MRNNLSREIGCWVFGRIVVPPDENIVRLEKRLETAMFHTRQCRADLETLRTKSILDSPSTPSIFEEMYSLTLRYEVTVKEIGLIKLQLQYPHDAVLLA